jgi:Cft2 family RNA processing exonuclease
MASQAIVPPLIDLVEDMLYVPALDWCVDATVPVPRAFVSHAHTDHFARHGEGHCSFETALLLQSSRSKPDRLVTHAMGHPVGAGDITFTLLPAGHILGSAQLYLEGRGASVLYAGDVRPGGSRTTPPAAVRAADLLIVEGTYSNARYDHTPPALAEQQAVEFVRRCAAQEHFPVFVTMGRAGKAQDLLLAMQEAGYYGALHASIFHATESYTKAGLAMPPCAPWTPGQPPEGDFLVVTASYLETVKHQLNVRGQRTAFLSGWAGEGGTHFDAYIAWSDHADFEELLDFVDRVAPREVWTFADRGRFAAELNRRGRRAQSLDGD